MNTLYLMCGFPAAGKSSYLERKITSHNQVVLSTDEFMLELTGREWHEPAEYTVRSHLKIAARILLRRGYDIFIDDLNGIVSERAEWIIMAREFRVPVICIYINTSFTDCVSANLDRRRTVPHEVMEDIQKQFVLPSIKEGFDEIHVYDKEGTLVNRYPNPMRDVRI